MTCQRGVVYLVFHNNIAKISDALCDNGSIIVCWHDDIPLSTARTNTAESESNTATGSTVVELAAKPRATSVVWKWFGGQLYNKPLLSISKKTVITKGGNSTNLFHHLNKRDKCQKSWEAISAAAVSFTSRRQTTLAQQSITKSLASCVVYFVMMSRISAQKKNKKNKPKT